MTRPILVFLAAAFAFPALVPAQTPAPAPVAVATTGRLPVDPAVTIGTLPNGLRYTCAGIRDRKSASLSSWR